MWNKIKNILLYVIRAMFLLSLIIGYFLSADFFINETGVDFSIGMSLWIGVACISLVQIDKEQNAQKHSNKIEKLEMFNLVKLLYETDYSCLDSVSSIVISNPWSESININMKNGMKVQLNLHDISWIKSYDDIKKLDENITNNPKNSETEYTLFLMGIKFDYI